MKNFFYLFLLILISQCRSKPDIIVTEFPGKPEVPSSLKETHESLLEQVHKLTLYNDSSRFIALKIEELMIHHFKEEEDYVLPQLGVLLAVANGQIPEKSEEIILLSETVKSHMNHLSAEHQLITAFIKELKEASAEENLPEINAFENEIFKHSTSEEEVFFPTSILIGEYLKLKSENKH